MIELFTTTELIEEINKRTTFVGIIFQSTKEDKINTKHKNWDISYSKLSTTQVQSILEDAIQHFKKL